MSKSLQKTNTVAALTDRAPDPAPEAADPRRDSTFNPWLSKQVAQRLEEGRTLLIDMATDLPFATVLRGRVAPPRKDVIKLAEPLAKIIQQFGPRLPQLTIDATYLRERQSLIDRLSAFEEAGENFLGLIKRTRAVIAAQLEKAMRGAYALAKEASVGVPELQRALQPLAPVLTETDKPDRKR